MFSKVYTQTILICCPPCKTYNLLAAPSLGTPDEWLTNKELDLKNRKHPRLIMMLSVTFTKQLDFFLTFLRQLDIYVLSWIGYPVGFTSSPSYQKTLKSEK